jgi:putative Holliday junction resolvase
MRILALDHGEKRIGIALSDELRVIASPLEFVPAEPFRAFVDRLRTLLREREVGLVLVGMPRNLNGTYGEAAGRVRSFVAALQEAIAVPVRTWDERLTTVQAQRSLRAGQVSRADRKTKVDAVAAAILLQSYLDAQTANSERRTANGD